MRDVLRNIMLTFRQQGTIVSFGVVVVLITVGSVFSYHHFGKAGLDILSVVATTSLTLALVLLYRKQHLALQYQHEPHLELSDVGIGEEFHEVELLISNYGGGAATSLRLKIELYEVNGDGPIDLATGGLKRVDREEDTFIKQTRGSSIRPSELNVLFTTNSKTVVNMGAGNGQDSLRKILTDVFDEDRDVVYGKLILEYETKFSDHNECVADFSLKFTNSDGLECKSYYLLPWQNNSERPELGG